MEAIAEKELLLARFTGGSNPGGSNPGGGGGSGAGGGRGAHGLMRQSSSPEDPKLQYLKNLMLKCVLALLVLVLVLVLVFTAGGATVCCWCSQLFLFDVVC